MNCIKTITDEDFGLKSVKLNNPRTRKGARGIVKRNDGKIALLFKSNMNEYKLPGGGIDENEDPKDAFKREVLEETEPGGLEHFDIDIYRNVDIIGGKVHEKIKLKDLYDKNIQNNNFIGYNEKSREEFLDNYFYKDDNVGDIENEQLAIEILYSCSKIIYNKYNHMEKIETIKIPKEEN